MAKEKFTGSGLCWQSCESLQAFDVSYRYSALHIESRFA